jgi:hypothetical protein
MVEFFVGFYNVIKDDLLKVVRESKYSSKFLGALNSTFLSLIPKKQKGFLSMTTAYCMLQCYLQVDSQDYSETSKAYPE